MTDFNTWNEETIAAVQKHLATQTPVDSHAEFQYIIDALDSLTDEELAIGFSRLTVPKTRTIPELLREGDYTEAEILLGASIDTLLPQEDRFWVKAYHAVRIRSREET